MGQGLADGRLDPTAVKLTRIFTALGALALVDGGLVSIAQRAAEPQPSRYACSRCNVILISIDTLRPDHLSCYGYPRATSPAIDELASRSIRFANARTTSAWTSPGHLSMLTGRYPTSEHEFGFKSVRPLDQSYVTLAEALKRADYDTAAFVGGAFVGARFGFAQGFAVYDSRGRLFRRNVRVVSDWLSRRDPAQPFFLFLHGYDVHSPYRPPPALHPLFVDEIPDACKGVLLSGAEGTLPCLQSPGGLRYLISQYDAEIFGADRSLEQIFSQLKRHGLYDKSIIVVTADHGEELFERGRLGHTATLHDELLRIPLLLHLPRIGPRVVDQPVSIVDLAPTLLDLLDVAPVSGMHGQSLVPLLQGAHYEPRIFALTGVAQGNVVLAVVHDGFKLIQQRSTRGAPWRYELYDLRADPGERTNLVYRAGRRSTHFAPLRARLKSWRRDIAVDLDGASPQPRLTLPPDVQEQLEALGYE